MATLPHASHASQACPGGAPIATSALASQGHPSHGRPPVHGYQANPTQGTSQMVELNPTIHKGHVLQHEPSPPPAQHTRTSLNHTTRLPSGGQPCASCYAVGNPIQRIPMWAWASMTQGQQPCCWTLLRLRVLTSRWMLPLRPACTINRHLLHQWHCLTLPSATSIAFHHHFHV